MADTTRLILTSDGTLRCRRCGLHGDTCTCRDDHPMMVILKALGLRPLGWSVGADGERFAREDNR